MPVGLLALLIVAWATLRPRTDRTDLVALRFLSHRVEGGRLYWDEARATACGGVDCHSARIRQAYLVACDHLDESARQLVEQFRTDGYRPPPSPVDREWNIGFVSRPEVSTGKVWVRVSAYSGARLPKPTVCLT